MHNHKKRPVWGVPKLLFRNYQTALNCSTSFGSSTYESLYNRRLKIKTVSGKCSFQKAVWSSLEARFSYILSPKSSLGAQRYPLLRRGEAPEGASPFLRVGGVLQTACVGGAS